MYNDYDEIISAALDLHSLVIDLNITDLSLVAYAQLLIVTVAHCLVSGNPLSITKTIILH